MTKKLAKTNHKTFKIVIALSLVIAIIAFTISGASMIRLQQVSDQQAKTDLINSFKINYTQSQLDNLRTCVRNGESDCPNDKYNNSSNWKKMIDKLLED